MAEPSCVGAFIRDEHSRAYVHRRSADRRLLPGIWDVVGGHLEPGESPEAALAREIEEETGWKLRRIEAVIAEWEWDVDERHTADASNRFRRYERDYLVEVDGDLSAPRLEPGKHDAYAWVGPDSLDLMMEGRRDGDRRLRDIVAKVVRTRLTDRLRLEPIGSEHVPDLHRLHAEPAVARWQGGAWTRKTAARRAAEKQLAWESHGVATWMAYDRGTGDLVGRGGVDRMAADWSLTRPIAEALSDPGWLADRLEVSWTVATGKQGNGYATEIGRAGLEFAFSDLRADQVVAFSERHNKASRAVMERLGMDFIAEITATQEDRLPAGGVVALYRLTRDKYRATR